MTKINVRLTSIIGKIMGLWNFGFFEGKVWMLHFDLLYGSDTSQHLVWPHWDSNLSPRPSKSPCFGGMRFGTKISQRKRSSLGQEFLVEFLIYSPLLLVSYPEMKGLRGSYGLYHPNVIPNWKEGKYCLFYTYLLNLFH